MDFVVKTLVVLSNEISLAIVANYSSHPKSSASKNATYLCLAFFTPMFLAAERPLFFWLIIEIFILKIKTTFSCLIYWVQTYMMIIYVTNHHSQHLLKSFINNHFCFVFVLIVVIIYHIVDHIYCSLLLFLYFVQVQIVI